MASFPSTLAMPRTRPGRVATAAGRTSRPAGFAKRPVATRAKLDERNAHAGFRTRTKSFKARKPEVKASASTPAVSAASATPPSTWKGADLKKLAACVLTAAIVWVIPPPAGITKQAWHLLAIFLGTIGKTKCDFDGRDASSSGHWSATLTRCGRPNTQWGSSPPLCLSELWQ